MISAFPTPPDALVRVLGLLGAAERAEASKTPEGQSELNKILRPWALADCPDVLRGSIWRWCEEVADWINHDYAWQPTQLIPPCWPKHSHIAQELPVLAILRWQAEHATTSAAMEDWHRFAFPMFCDRMMERLGESGCRTGRHIDWPAAGGYAAYNTPAAAALRNRAINADIDVSPTR
jgi:hypothetical protein